MKAFNIDHKTKLWRNSTIIMLGLLMIVSSLPPISWAAQKKGTPKKTVYQLTEPERIIHALTRLSFGIQPGDFDYLRTIGVDKYIDEQLNPDLLADTSLEAQLAKLPTLAMASPAIFERFNPPMPPPMPAKPPMEPTPTAPTTAPNTSTSTVPKIETNTSESPKPAAEMSKEAGMSKEINKAETKGGMDAKTGSTTPPVKPQTPQAPNPQQVMTELQRAKLLRAVYSHRQLYEIMVSFWENHFSIFSGKDSERFLLTSFDRDSIRPFALGRFRDLLSATAHSPAMLYYLDNWQSTVVHNYPAANGKPARTTGGINENYAREIMELHTLGVNGGYTQQDVQEVARCFTGWTIRKPNEEGLFVFNPAIHDNGEKIVLGERIPAGGGISDGERVLDILAHHPSTARFVATKLARRFISDDPPVSVIERAATVFLKTDGSIRETLRTIITAPEFFSHSAYRAKVKSPFEYTVSAIRILGADTDGDRPILDWLSRMGEPLFGKLTPNGYADRAEEWLSSTTLVERLNFSVALLTNGIKGTHVDTAKIVGNLKQTDTQVVVDELVGFLLNGNVEANTRTILTKAASELPPAQTVSKPPAKPNNAMASLIALVIGAPEFQHR